MQRFPDWYGGPDVRRYTYRLTDDGRNKVDALKGAHPDEWQRIQEAVAAIKRVVPDLEQKTLSSAAKTYLIVSESEETVSEDEIPDLARHLGWTLNKAQVRKTVEILEELGLLEVEQAGTS